MTDRARSAGEGSRRSRKRTVRRVILRITLYGAAFAVLVGLALGWLFYREIALDLPSVEQLAGYRPPVASQVFASDGTLIGEFYFEKRYLVPLEEIPPVVREAFLAAEDAHFYQHQGIDLQGIARAFVNNLVAGQVTQGGSTITQQVVKSLLLTPKKSYERKIKEIILARRLESELTKDEILWLYLNQIYLGSGAYGVAAAAQEYFGKPIGEVTLPEAAMLAGLPQAPSRYSPIRHPERAKGRQRYVLRRMQAQGFITPEEREAAEAAELDVSPNRAPAYRAASDMVEFVRRSLEDRYGDRAPYQLGLRIYTPVDLEMQAAAEAAVRQGLRDFDKRRGYRGAPRRLSEAEAETFLAEQTEALERSGLAKGQILDGLVTGIDGGLVRLRLGDRRAALPPSGREWAGQEAAFAPGDVIRVRVETLADDGSVEVSLEQEPEVEGALLAMEARTGYVRAMVGSYDFRRSQFNRSIQAMRQPGSAFKPLVYAAALDRGYTPASVVIDAPIVYDDRSAQLWKPENYDEKFHGATRLREALTYSRNIISVKLAQDIGLGYILDYLPRFGFDRPFPHNLSIALGSSEVTLLELVRAYGVFANGGRLNEPIFVMKITDQEGNVIEERIPESEEAISPQTAYLMTSMLQEVVRRGTATRAGVLNRPVAGKTGTTNDLVDAWFLGFTPDLVAGAWVGFDEKKTLGRRETGGRAALPIWVSFMQQALQGKPVTQFEIPSDIVFVNIDRKTGLRAPPESSSALLECFRRGTEPQRFARAAASEPSAEEFFRGDF